MFLIGTRAARDPEVGGAFEGYRVIEWSSLLRGKREFRSRPQRRGTSPERSCWSGTEVSVSSGGPPPPYTHTRCPQAKPGLYGSKGRGRWVGRGVLGNGVRARATNPDPTAVAAKALVNGGEERRIGGELRKRRKGRRRGRRKGWGGWEEGGEYGGGEGLTSRQGRGVFAFSKRPINETTPKMFSRHPCAPDTLTRLHSPVTRHEQDGGHSQAPGVLRRQTGRLSSTPTQVATPHRLHCHSSRRRSYGVGGGVMAEEKKWKERLVKAQSKEGRQVGVGRGGRSVLLFSAWFFFLFSFHLPWW